MKKMLISFLILLGISGKTSLYSQTKNQANEIKPRVEVYYFHFTRRCQTCRMVEENSQQALKELYPRQTQNGEYVFKGLNLDEPEGKNLAKTLNINGQALLVISGSKKLDITDKGFLNAYNLPRLKEEMRKAVEAVKN